jgi:hypothetical protein
VTRAQILSAFLACISVLAPGAPRADDAARTCDRVLHRGLAEGPVVVGLYDADWGTGRRACLRSELAIAERLGATIDTKDFYGGVRADTIIAGSVRLRPRLELLGALELVRYEFAQNASLKASALGLGQLTLGLQGLALETRRWALSAYGRVLVPTASTTPSVQTTGVEVGVAASFRPHRKVEVHGHLAGDFTVGLSAGPPDVRGGTALLLGVSYTPATWFGLTIDLQAVLGHRAALDALLPQLALRFRLWRALGLELAGTAPVAGADRRLALATLRLGWRF